MSYTLCIRSLLTIISHTVTLCIRSLLTIISHTVTMCIRSLLRSIEPLKYTSFISFVGTLYAAGLLGYVVVSNPHGARAFNSTVPGGNHTLGNAFGPVDTEQAASSGADAVGAGK